MKILKFLGIQPNYDNSDKKSEFFEMSDYNFPIKT